MARMADFSAKVAILGRGCKQVFAVVRRLTAGIGHGRTKVGVLGCRTLNCEGRVRAVMTHNHSNTEAKRKDRKTVCWGQCRKRRQQRSAARTECVGWACWLVRMSHTDFWISRCLACGWLRFRLVVTSVVLVDQALELSASSPIRALFFGGYSHCLAHYVSFWIPSFSHTLSAEEQQRTGRHHVFCCVFLFFLFSYLLFPCYDVDDDGKEVGLFMTVMIRKR